MKRNYVQIFILALILLILVTGCKAVENANTPVEAEEKSVAVEIKEIERMDIASSIILNGRITPIKEVVILPKLAGKIVKVNFEVGQKVKKGEVLFIMDEKDVRLQIAQSKASLDVAKTNLDRSKGSSVEQQLEQTRIAFEGAETSFNNAKDAYDEAKDLYVVGAIQKDALDRAESQYNGAEQQYNSAKSNLELTKNKSIPESIAVAEAQYSQALAGYDVAKSQLDNIKVTSPIDGIVSTRGIEEGELAGSASPAMTIVDISDVTVDVNVTESIINTIKLGDIVKVSISSIQNKLFEGEITNISPNTDPRLQTYPVKVKISNEDGILKGGMFGEVEFILEESKNTLVIPLSSIKNEDGINTVYIVEEEKAYKKEITTGIQNDQYVEVKSGLKDADNIVIKGQDFLLEGAKVIVK